MFYELPLDEKMYNKLQQFTTGKKDHCFFKIIGVDETLFILAHGTEDGQLQINNTILSIEQVLNSIINKAKRNNITEVYTISCFGGAQPSLEIDGITIKSIHGNKTEIDTNVMATLDDEFFINIYIPE